jgi:glutamine synthetase
MGRSEARMQAVAAAAGRRVRQFDRIVGSDGAPLKTSEYFGSHTFSFDLMERTLPASDVAFLKGFATSREPLPLALADQVARAVKEWAISKGATHYCHWFQPQTGATAEKHDAFFSLDDDGSAIEKFGGKQLIQAEPDASSFPSGGVRATFEARGYTAWDASSPMFLMQTDNGLTLCIPSLFCSYGGEALDKKTPLLRSIARLSDVAIESLKLLGETGVKHVTVTAGPEQEYFLVDEAFAALRPDLTLTGRALIGKQPPRHQQLEDHYFGSIKPRVLSFMTEVEQELYRLGVPVKTRHNEVAPAQFEAAPIFENANVAADHNQLVMEVIKSVARRHRMVALFHEKPFAGINGSGKHVNWSMADSNGHNLLEPGDKPHDNLRFLYFLASVLKAVHTHGDALRMSVASPGNDFRLGANEAPPAIMSTFLGETLTEVLERITGGAGAAAGSKERASVINFDLAKVPTIARDNTDRNRTSPFAFTGNKFEFRAVGASASISMPLIFVNAAVAWALTEMNAAVKAAAQGGKPTNQHILSVIEKVVQETKAVRFEGDNYSAAWHEEAERRGLPNLKTTPEALKVMKQPKLQKMLASLGIMSEAETTARYNVRVERYNKTRMIELETQLELLSTHVVPALVAHQGQVAQSINAAKAAGASGGVSELTRTAAQLDKLLAARDQLAAFIGKCQATHDEEALAAMLADTGIEVMNQARIAANDAEAIVDDQLWSLPKFREMLHVL